jgi:CBS domain-containing protein
MGGAVGALESAVLPGGDRALWPLVSMAAVLGGTMRSPLTGAVFALELTHDLNTLPALLLASIISYGFTVLLMKRSILTEKVARRGYHVMREYAVSPFARFRVEDVMERNVPTIPADLRVDVIVRRLLQHDPVFGRRHAWPLVNAQGALVGLLTRGDLLEAIDREQDGDPTVLEIGTTNPIVAYPDDLLADALDRMIRSGVGRLPVVNRDEPTRLVGMLSRDGLAAAYRAVLEEEHVRESAQLRARFRELRRRLRPKAASRAGDTPLASGSIFRD